MHVPCGYHKQEKHKLHGSASVCAISDCSGPKKSGCGRTSSCFLEEGRVSWLEKSTSSTVIAIDTVGALFSVAPSVPRDTWEAHWSIV